ncbi:hypothetical protein [Leptolyngbya ohadii]|uniref:hypothetical protein n=1 Tax=Leptolyngbya ohadii TaxID=1962290 RepID=UPI000B59F244|nr:hypothetical protein [Leptolyngbya ohadii]
MNELTPESSQLIPDSEGIPEEVGLIETGMRQILILTLILALLAVPMMNLVHPSIWQRGIGFWHSLFSFLAAGFNIATGLMLFPLVWGKLSISRSLLATGGAAITTLLSLLTGLSAFSRYNAPMGDAAGVFIQVVSPLMQVVMIWHQLTSLSLMGLSLSIFYCLWVYGKHLMKPEATYAQLRLCLYVSLGLVLFFTITEMLGGLALAKVHSL